MKYIIIGTGNISNTYREAIETMKGSELVGYVSRSSKKKLEASDIPIFKDLNSVNIKFDAVIIATPNGLHCQGIINAANSGKHIITEKPLGITMESMNEAIKACENARVTLAVAYQRRTSPDNIRIKQLLDEGKLGIIFSADLSAKFYRDMSYYNSADYRGGWQIDGGGPFIQQACHQIDLYAWFFGIPEKIVSMLDTFTHDIETEDHGAALLRYKNGMIGSIITSTATKPGFASRLEVHSETGSFIMEDDHIAEWHFDEISNPADQSFKYKHDGATSASVSDISAHLKILQNFEESVKLKKSPIADGKSAMKTTELILKIYNSTV